MLVYDRPIITSQFAITFLINCRNPCKFPLFGNFAQLTDDLNIKYNGKHNSSASSFINLGWNPSGPGDFPVLRFCNNFLTSSIENSSGICRRICFSSKLIKSPSGSLVNTLAKYYQ